MPGDPRLLCVGPTPRSVKAQRRRDRLALEATRLAAQKIRLQNAEISARERADDREIERLRIDERRRAREFRAEEKKKAKEDKRAASEMEIAVAKVKEKLEASRIESEDRAAKERELEAQIAELMKGIEGVKPEGT